jgi:hypothetical protein
MTAALHAVTDEKFRNEPLLPLHHRAVTVVKTVSYFYCSKCGGEERFMWSTAHCTETGELICDRIACGRTCWKLCRRCRQPRRYPDQFTASYLGPPGIPTICNECCVQKPEREPLQVACVHCGKPFTANRSDARFCSGRCRTAAHRAEKRSTP